MPILIQDCRIAKHRKRHYLLAMKLAKNLTGKKSQIRSRSCKKAFTAIITLQCGSKITHLILFSLSFQAFLRPTLLLDCELLSNSWSASTCLTTRLCCPSRNFLNILSTWCWDLRPSLSLRRSQTNL